MLKIRQLYLEIFTDRDFYRQMLKLSLPVMLQNFISAFLNMIDTVMVGKLGETEIAAVGIANQYFFFFMMFMIGLSAGCGVFIAQFWGKRDSRNIKRILGIGLGTSVMVSLLFMVLGWLIPDGIMALFNNDPRVIRLGAGYLKIVLVSYLFTGITIIYNFSLRSLGITVEPMLISGLAVICNAFFNYVFIFGKMGAPAMGVEGAALATVIARVMEAGVLTAVVYKGKSALAASFKELTDLSLEFIKKSYRTIFPVLLNDICWGLGTMVYAAVYGRMGAQAVAAVQICNTTSNLFMVAIFGISSAAAVMLGQRIGAGEYELSRDYARRFCILAIILGIILGLLLAAASPWILNMFNLSMAARHYSQIILYLISALFFIRIFDIVLIVGILRGGGDVRQALLIEGFTMWGIGVPLTILGAFVFKLPIYAVYALALLEEVVKGIIGTMRLKSGRWINNVTHGMEV
ncbi:MAG: MATE family efflux transporter [Firmicutes bacterium]|nr:MATE family efflux transporter [Bacillota bacterium]